MSELLRIEAGRYEVNGWPLVLIAGAPMPAMDREKFETLSAEFSRRITEYELSEGLKGKSVVIPVRNGRRKMSILYFERPRHAVLPESAPTV